MVWGRHLDQVADAVIEAVRSSFLWAVAVPRLLASAMG
jgi:hypothetical protein